MRENYEFCFCFLSSNNIHCTGCLKIDATHLYDNDLLLRKVQWRPFGTRRVKKSSFELETSNQYVLIVIISVSRTCNLFFRVSCLSNKSLSYK